MRLSAEEQQKIINIFDSFIKDFQAELRLFGSRTIDTKRGGDIDLLLVTKIALDATFLRKNRHKIHADLLLKLGEQKIDITVAYRTEIKTNPFIAMIYPIQSF